MIKKMSQRLLVKISKMPLYWKTWTVTAGTILMTIGVFFIIFGLFASKFLTLSQQRKFDQKAEMIFNEISQGGVDTEKLEEHMLQGFTVFVSQKDQLIFPAFASLVITDGVQFDEKSLEGYYRGRFSKYSTSDTSSTWCSDFRAIFKNPCRYNGKLLIKGINFL